MAERLPGAADGVDRGPHVPGRHPPHQLPHPAGVEVGAEEHLVPVARPSPDLDLGAGEPDVAHLVLSARVRAARDVDPE